jgi:flagellar biosynthesis/type III secretory pathway protein FliH
VGDRARDIGVIRSEAYARGHREGIRHGEEDARRGRQFDYARVRVYRTGTAGYHTRLGSREAYRTDFRYGFVVGYRAGFERITRVQLPRGQVDVRRGVQRAYYEPAYARGYADGHEKGLDDGRRRRSYDPVGHRAYRQGDAGYSKSYGSKDVYKNNYRAGFRLGYEEGYRNSSRALR